MEVEVKTVKSVMEVEVKTTKNIKRLIEKEWK